MRDRSKAEWGSGRKFEIGIESWVEVISDLRERGVHGMGGGALYILYEARSQQKN